VTLSILPAALIFRARYRAYGQARRVLAVAILMSVPYGLVQAAALSTFTEPLEGLAALLVLGVLLASLSGFMGEHTTAGGVVWAALLLVILPADLAFRGFSSGWGAEAWLHLRVGAGTAAAALLVALGAYQILAGWLGDDARRIAKGRDAPAEA
jgi:hypothetical protein